MVACCRQYSDTQANYGSCLNAALKAWAIESKMKECEVSYRVLDALDTGKVLLASTLVLSQPCVLVMTNDKPIRLDKCWLCPYRNCSTHVVLGDEQIDTLFVLAGCSRVLPALPVNVSTSNPHFGSHNSSRIVTQFCE